MKKVLSGDSDSLLKQNSSPESIFHFSRSSEAGLSRSDKDLILHCIIVETKRISSARRVLRSKLFEAVRKIILFAGSLEMQAEKTIVREECESYWCVTEIRIM